MNFCHVESLDDIIKNGSGYDTLWKNPKVTPTFCSRI